MGLFTPFGGGNQRKVTKFEYEKSGGIRSRIMGKLSGSWSQKEKKMAELENAIRPSMDLGGKTRSDDGVDAEELNQTFENLRHNDKHLDLSAEDMKKAEDEFRKKL